MKESMKFATKKKTTPLPQKRKQLDKNHRKQKTTIIFSYASNDCFSVRTKEMHKFGFFKRSRIQINIRIISMRQERFIQNVMFCIYLGNYDLYLFKDLYIP